MKRKLGILLSVMLVITGVGFARVPTGLAFGWEISERAGHLGSGLNLTSPYFLWDRAAVRLRGEVLLDNQQWMPSYMVKAGLIGVGGMVADSIRLYGEGGFLFLFPHSTISPEISYFGGYGHFGFEFFMDKMNAAYFIELGTSGSRVLISGFSITTGLRIHLW